MSKEIKVWRYSLPSEKHEGWGVILMDSTGVFSAVTDYGNYSYWWASHGRKDFREFVMMLHKSPDYLCSKITKKDDFDAKGTLQRIKEHILSYRKDGTYGKNWARREWDLLIGLHDWSHEFEFQQWLEDTHIEEAYDFFRYDYDGMAKNFATKLMARLSKMIQEELEKEALELGVDT